MGTGIGEEVILRPLRRQDEETAEALLDAEMAGRMQARLDEVHDVLAFPGLAAWVGYLLVGIATHRRDGKRVELASIAVARGFRGRGIGVVLVDAVASTLAAEGADCLWLVTTNDNLDALRLYQRHRFRLTELRVGAVDRARSLKPTIPVFGCHGIPVHDELVLARCLR